MAQRALSYLSWLLLVGQVRSRLDRLPPGDDGSQRLAAGLGLVEEATTLSAVVALAAEEVEQQARQIDALERRCAQLARARRARHAQGEPHPQVSLREALRRLPFGLRERVMDWVRQPYVGGSLSSRNSAEDAAMAELLERFHRLDVDAARLAEQVRGLDQGLRLPPLPAFALRREAALDAVPAARAALLQLAGRATGELTDRYRHLCNVGVYRDNLQALAGRIDPSLAGRKQAPQPLPDLAPDQLRVFARRVLPRPLRKRVLAWILQ